MNELLNVIESFFVIVMYTVTLTILLGLSLTQALTPVLLLLLSLLWIVGFVTDSYLLMLQRERDFVEAYCKGYK